MSTPQYIPPHYDFNYNSNPNPNPNYNQNYNPNYDPNYINKTFEKKSIAKTSSCFGMSCILFYVISFAVNLIALFIAWRLSANPDIANDKIMVLTKGIVYLFSTLLPLPIGFMLFAKIDKVSIKNDIPYGIKNKKAFWVLLGAIPLLVFIANFVFGIISAIVNLLGGNFENTQDISLGDTPAEIIFMIFVIGVLTPFVEEFAFRGVALSALRRYGDTFAVCVTAVLFGSLHGSFFNACVATIIGFLFGYAVIKTGSIWVSIILHAFNNINVCVLQVASTSDNNLLQAIIAMLYLGIVVTCGVTAIAFYFSDKKRAFKFKLDKSVSYLTGGEKVIALISIPMIIAVILIFGYSFIAGILLPAH